MLTVRAHGSTVMLMVKAVFPGSFDPPTYGHLNIIERARLIFGEVHVVVAVNREKNYTFSAEERVELIRDMVRQWDTVQVHAWDTLIVDYARKIKAHVLVRGVRNITDFSYEFDLAMMNRSLNPEIETVFLSPDPQYFVLRSSAIKELAAFGGDVSSMVPQNVADLLTKKLRPSVISTKNEKM